MLAGIGIETRGVGEGRGRGESVATTTTTEYCCCLFLPPVGLSNALHHITARVSTIVVSSLSKLAPRDAAGGGPPSFGNPRFS